MEYIDFMLQSMNVVNHNVLEEKVYKKEYWHEISLNVYKCGWAKFSKLAISVFLNCWYRSNLDNGDLLNFKAIRI